MYDFLYGLMSGFLDAFNNFSDFLGGLVSGIGDFFGSLLVNIINALKDILLFLLKPIIDVLLGILFLFQKLYEIGVLIIKIIGKLFQLVGQLITEVTGAISGLNYTGSTGHYSVPNAYQGGFSAVTNILDQTGFNTIAVIMAFFIWIMTAYCVIKIATKKG